MSPSAASLPNDRRARWAAPVMVFAAAGALGLWLVSGAYGWRGYPAEHPGGRAIAAVLGLLSSIILVAIGLMAIGRRTPSGRVLALAVGCWTVARLVTASLFPLGSDEAYHWLWAQHLDLCYYDHPGMVAWLARLFAPFGGEATAAVRLSGVILGALLPAMAAYLAWITLRDAEIAVRSALVVMLVPILSGSTFLMPALPVLFFWLLASIQLWRALQSGRAYDWLLLGLAYGAALNCNFTTFLFSVCGLAYLIVSPAHRIHLTKPGPYVSVIVAVCCFLPVILWNSQHDWRTFGFNFLKRHRDLSFHPDQALLYLGQLLLYLSPLLAAGLIAAGCTSLYSTIRNPQSAQSSGCRYLAILGLAPIAAFLITSILLKARAHYAAPAFVPLIVLFVATIRGWYRPAVIVGLVMTIGFWWVLLLTALAPAPTMHNLFTKIDAKDPDKPTAELYGWPALGCYLDSFGQRMDAQSRTVVIALSYAQASLAMHYSRNLDYAFSLDEGKSPYGQQFEMWGPLSRIPMGCDAILFRAGRHPDEDEYAKELRQNFERIERVDAAAAGFDSTLRYFTIWRGYGYRGGYGR